MTCTHIFQSLLVVTALGMVGACSKSGTVTRDIAGYTFEIPRRYLIEATVFYLPGQERSLRFVLDPTAPLGKQNMVSIHPDATCPPVNVGQPVDPRCQVIATPLSRLEQEKLTRVGDEIFWQYRFETGGELVAYCSKLERGDGLCAHYGLYKDLPYRLGLRDSQIGNLVELRRAVEEKLSKWEAR